MNEIFVFLMYAMFYVLASTATLTIFYFCNGVLLNFLKHHFRLRLVMRNNDLFGDFGIITPKMRIEMVYVMKDRAEKNLDHLRVFEKYVDKNYEDHSRLMVYGEK